MVYNFFKEFKGTRAEFNQGGFETTYANNIVIIKDEKNNGAGACIYARGMYFADLQSLISGLAFVKGINVGGQNYNAANGGGYIKFEAADPTTVVYVDNNGVKVGLSATFVQSVNDVIAEVATIKGDYLTSADRTAIEGLIATAKSEAIAAVVGTSADTKDSKTIEGVRKYVDEKTADIASNTEFSTLKGRVDTIEGDYLKEADKTALQNSINDVSGQLASDKAELQGNIDTLSGQLASDKAELQGNINGVSQQLANDKSELQGAIATAKGEAVNASKVTMEEAAGSGDILKSYTFKQDGAVIGTINLPKDVVVTSGAIVMHEGVECLELTLTSGDIVHIPVTDLVDVYTAGAFITISDQNQISVDKAGIIEGLASETFVNGKIEAEVSRSDKYADDAVAAAIAAEVTRSNSYADGKANTAEQNAKTYADNHFVKTEGYVAYSQAEKTKLANVAEGAQVNVIESLEVNGVAATLAGKKASVTVDCYTKEQVNAELAKKANVGDSYTKSEADNMFVTALGWEVIG